jgi:hypothetical protein
MIERLDRVLDHSARARLARWYWAAMFLGPSGPSVLAQGSERLAAWLADGRAEPSEIEHAREFLTTERHRKRLERASRNDPEYLALETVLSQQGARDLFTGELISVRGCSRRATRRSASTCTI